MAQDTQILWYDNPAKQWTQALPIGNGQLGAMLFGGTKTERITLNHDELWSGYPKNTTRPGSADAFYRARALAMQGKLHAAQAVIEEEHNSVWSQAYMPLGEMEIKFSHLRGAVTNYRRSLDLRDAVCRTQFTCGDVQYTREAFASYPDGVIALHLCAQGGPLSFSVSLASENRPQIFTQDGLLLLDGECPSEHNKDNVAGQSVYYDEPQRRGIRYRAAVKIETDGALTQTAQTLQVTNAAKATLYFTAESSYNGWQKQPFVDGKPYKEPCLARLADCTGYARLLQRHTADYKALYNRVELDLGSGGKENIPTDKRLVQFAKTKDDLGLYTLLYNYGRYLAIAASRPGSQPMNLQGIWNHRYDPPWKSNYTVNINTEMNYWPVLATNMPQLHEPLLAMIGEIAQAGKATAAVHYNAPGFTCHHNIDLWRLTTPVAGCAQWSFWPFASGWLCRHLYEHYLYTQDLNFLRKTAYPIMRDAAAFYLHLLVEDENGYLIFAPATSPENSFVIDGDDCSVAKTSTMSMSIIRDLLQNTVIVAITLQADDINFDIYENTLQKLLPFQIGSQGQLLEWDQEYPEADPHHRHVSHLYALHPARLISPQETPQLAEACRRTLELRGDDGTGWSLGWKINFWARLLDGNHALALLERQLRPVKSQGVQMHQGGGTYENLFDAHPPFQIDGNFGAVSGITEMLLQSTPDTIYLLPALPDKWANGHVRGLCAMGNIQVDIAWQNGKLTHCHLTGERTAQRVVYGKAEQTVALHGETALVF